MLYSKYDNKHACKNVSDARATLAWTSKAALLVTVGYVVAVLIMAAFKG